MTIREAALVNDAAGDLIRKRRAVYTALAPHLKPTQLFAALWLWEEEFSRGPSMALQAFLDRLGRHLKEPPQDRRILHRSLVDTLGRPEAELAPDPMPHMLESLAGKLPVECSAAGDPYQRFDPIPLRVFAELMSRFMSELARHEPGVRRKLGSYIAQHLPRLGLAPAELAELGQWLNGVSAKLSRPLPETMLRNLVHTGYVAACEYVGPVLTDRCLAQGLRAAEALAEAKDYDPRRLL